MTARLLNYALYQAGWLCCVLGGARGYAWQGAAAALLLVAVHLALSPRRRSGEIKLLLVAAALGAVADSLQSCAGLLQFRSGHLTGCLAPPWIVVMWIQFVTLFRFALSFLIGRLALSAILGLVGGPLAFVAGERLGAVTFAPSAATSLIVLAGVWATSMPLLAWLAERWIDPATIGRYRGPGAITGPPH